MRDLKHFAKTIRCIKSECPDTVVESLIPDFSGNEKFIQTIVQANPHVIGHNIETVQRLSHTIRDPRAKLQTITKSFKKYKRIRFPHFYKILFDVGVGGIKR